MGFKVGLSTGNRKRIKHQPRYDQRPVTFCIGVTFIIIRGNALNYSSHNKTFYQTKNPKVTQVIVKNNCLCLDSYYRKKTDGFNETELMTPKALGTINYFERVKKIGTTKKKKVFNS